MSRVEINAMEITNTTIKKLDAVEVGKLGLVNCGVYTYKGTPKSRLKGLKTTMRTEDEIHYESESNRWEIIKLQDSGRFNVDEYALRLYSKLADKYVESYQILIGCDFFK